VPLLLAARSWSRRACEICILAPGFYFSIIHGPHDSGQSMLLGKILISIAFYYSFRERKEWFLLPSPRFTIQRNEWVLSSHIIIHHFCKAGIVTTRKIIYYNTIVFVTELSQLDF
jgi:hypothetical protein